MILKKIVQIWFGRVPKKNKECMGQVKTFAESIGVEYELIKGKSLGSVAANIIASNNLRLEIMRTCRRTLYVDSDIVMQELPDFNVNIPAFSTVRRIPVEAIMYSGDTRWFQRVQNPTDRIGGLKKVLSLKYLREDNNVDIIPEKSYIHYEYSKQERYRKEDE